MASVMMRHGRARTGLGVLVGLSLPLALAAPGCLRTLDQSLIGAHDAGSDSAGASGTGGSAGTSGTGGSAGTDASAGSAGGGGASGSSGTGGSAGAGGLPDGGFTAWNATDHPVKTLANAFDSPLLIAADNTDVFRTKRGAPPGDTAALIVSTPLDGSASTPVTSTDLNRAMGLIAPTGTLFVYFVGGTSGIGEIGRYLKAPGGSPNPKVLLQTGLDASTIEQAVGIAAGSDNYAYVTARSVAPNNPTVLRFKLEASATTADTLYTTTTGGETGGDITESNDCVYWISNGSIWVMQSTGADIFRKNALAKPVTDAIGLASDTTNFYYTRSNGEVWQRKLSPSPACDGSGPAEKIIAGGYTGIGDLIVYAPGTVAWAVKGDPGNSFAGGGIFTTPVDGYAVVQIAPATDGVDQISDAGNDVAYVTTTGSIRKVPK